MFSKSMEWTSGDVRARDVASWMLLVASRLLARWARVLRAPGQGPTRSAVVLEFYAEAGAPEGALYIDGQLVGRLPGVTRL